MSKESASFHTERIAVSEDLPSVGHELNEVFLGENMGNRESKEAAAHAARLAEQAESKPAAVAADLEAHNKARATEQGGRWLEKDIMPHTAPSQKQQSEVREAVKASHQPAAEEKEALREAARHKASGGRW